MHKITNIVIHCSDSNFGTASMIISWHLARGWRDIGYHFVVLNGYPANSWLKSGTTLPCLEGSIEVGRPVDEDLFLTTGEAGAHSLGFNHNSIGVCVILKHGRYCSAPTMLNLKWLVKCLTHQYKISLANVIGHYETGSPKTCPNFNMDMFRTFVDDQLHISFLMNEDNKFFTFQ